MIQSAPDGYYIQHNNRFIHLNEKWLTDMDRHQVKPRRAKVDGRVVLGDNERAFNKLRHAVQTNKPKETILGLFVEFRDGLTQNRVDRSNLGLKAVTKDGDEDLRAVQQGAPVRPWNAVQTNKPLHDWIREQRADRK